MYRLHIYNPEHDIALGKNSSNFTPPKAAVMTRRAYGHYPAFWADDGDWVLVDDVQHASRMLADETRRHAHVKFMCMKDLCALTVENMPSEILPWGWDKLLVDRLLRCNPLFVNLVPGKEQLDLIRKMSSREFAASNILPRLVSCDERLVGEVQVIRSVDQLSSACESSDMQNDGIRFVLKSPWSCSGRGVRFVPGDMSESLMGWCRNVLQEQGALMLEPYYDNVCDFAMEFVSDKQEGTRCLGLNVFTTSNGAYMENSAFTEAEKWSRLARYVDPGLLDLVRESVVDITSELFRGKYAGPFGVDMMVVRSAEGYRIHPCVELNLRRTMGHAAL